MLDKKNLFVLFLGLIIFFGAVLRMYKLNENPPSLYWDEVSLGYNAYSILTTAHDEHGEFMPISRFIAFGDYKPPGYIYAIVPFMAIFGIGEVAIRLPSVMSGIAFILLSYLLVRALGGNRKLGLFSAFVIAFSPWSIQLSRVAFEAHLAAVFNLLGVLFFLKSSKKPSLLIGSAVFFVASFYTFNANRIIAPLLALLLFIIYRKDVLRRSKWLVTSAIVGGLLLAPSVPYLMTRESRLRFQEVSIFNELSIIEKSNEQIERNDNSLLARIIHNRRVYFGLEFLKHYTDHFKGEFLFIKGDRNPRLSIQSVGELYWFELPLLIIGSYMLIKRWNKTTALLFSWLAISIIPAATARETPHMLRIASSLPIWHILIAQGWYFVADKFNEHSLKWKNVGKTVIACMLIFSVGYYLHQFWRHYPDEWSGEWQYGYKELVQKVERLADSYDAIYIRDHFGRPYIYFLFYGKVNPIQYLAERRATRDWYGFWEVQGFGKYSFGKVAQDPPQKSLLITGPGNIGKDKLIDTVKNPQGNVLFEIGTL